MHCFKARILTHYLLATQAEVNQNIHQSVHFLPLTIVVWEKFTVGYFRVKIVHGKIFSSTGVSKF